ncbi:sensor histidine kinase [Arcobacter sp. YIC-464]|uniref:sensor histidine kinase n=1 Tax=Arcobacter sp. YIC-464 TaxID=3376631 RepID=UPI003C151B5C
MYKKVKKLFDIKVIYTIVFITLASWSFFAYFTMSTLIEKQKVYAKIINLSGKQRMLSQKTTLIAKRYFESNDYNLKKHLNELILLMEKEHTFIIKNLTSSESKKIYFENPKDLDKKVKLYLSMLKEFYEKNESSKLEQIQNYSFSLLPILNDAVYQFEKESDQMTKDLLAREIFILIGTLVTLLLEAILIVIPSIRLTEKREKELKELNINLERKVEKAVKENNERDNILKHQFRLAQMGEMVKNIAHHWRQPLSIISSLASCMKLEKEMNILDENKLTENLDSIVNQTQKLSNILDDFSLYTQETAEDLVYFNIVKSINLTTNLLSASFDHENIKIEKEFFEEDIRIEGNNIKFRQVILNILNNAKDSLLESNIKDKYIKISIKQKNKAIVIQVKNNGKKIDENIIDKIFDIYFTTKHQAQGTGLGLFLCHEIVTKYFKGTIHAKNLEDGVCFKIVLPKVHS